MKIALGIFKYFPFGGLQIDMRNIALEFARRGEEVTVFTGEWNSPESFPGVNVEILKLSSLSNHRKALEFSRAFHRKAENFDIKVAFNRFGGCDFYFAADDCYTAGLNRRKGAFLLRHFGRYKVFSELEKSIFSPHARTVVFYICQKQFDEFRSTYGTPVERLIYLGPGVGEQYDQKVQLAEVILLFYKLLIPKPVLDLWMARRIIIMENEFRGHHYISTFL